MRRMYTPSIRRMYLVLPWESPRLSPHSCPALAASLLVPKTVANLDAAIGLFQKRAINVRARKNACTSKACLSPRHQKYVAEKARPKALVVSVVEVEAESGTLAKI